MIIEYACKMLILSLTGSCNFACSYCYADEQPQRQMAFDTAVKAIRLAAQGNRPFLLQFSGGEPLLAFDLIQEIVAYIRCNHIAALLQLQTNASLLDERIARFLRREGIGVGVSLDGRPPQNDRQRLLPSGEGSSELIMRGVRALAAAGIETGVTCVVTAANVRELAGVVEIAYYLGNVRKLGFDLLRAQGRGVGVKPAAAGELAAALRQVLATASRLERATGKRLLFSQQERAENLARCRTAGFAHCHAMNGEAVFVTVDGELYACASLAGFSAFRLGHVDSGIDPACRRRIGERIRASMTFCSACRYFSGCGGACFARWYGAGQPDSPYLPECVLKQAFIPGQQAGEQ